MGQGKLAILQITDTHLFADPAKQLLGLNTEDSCAAVIRAIQQDEQKPDLILLTGDIAQDSSELAYHSIAQKLIPFHCPVYWIPGNHDSAGLMKKTFQQFSHMSNDKLIQPSPWQIILLDSQKPGAVEGLLADQQINFLKKYLTTNNQLFTLLVIHHHVVPIQSAWLDTLALENAHYLLTIIQENKHIKSVVCGHIHQAFEKVIDEVVYYATPSTCFQFKPRTEKFALDDVAPGYRWIFLNDDGTLTSRVERVKGFSAQAYASTSGY
ncbi:MAG: 3',5'-cyclic-AMP phosphodiesterase [Legionellales bacterium]|nr:3',5'-cyclic-AMP phosphodiesterase [Legionellales bacterium]